MATRSMEVDVRARGAGGLARELRDAAAAARELQREADALRNLQVGGGGGTANRVRSQGAATATAARQERFLSGPRQDLIRIQADRTRAQALPEDDVRRPAILGDLADREARARRRVILNERLKGQGEEGLQAPGLLESFQKLNSLMGSIRSGNVLGALGAGVQLLGGRNAGGGLNIEQLFRGGTAGAIRAGTAEHAAIVGAQVGGVTEEVAGTATALESLGAAAGPAGMALAAATAAMVGVGLAVKQFVQDLSQVAESLNQFNRAQVASGGTRAETLGLTARGIPAGAIPGMAAQLRERLSSDPLAMMASGVGFRMPRPFGTANEARDLLEVLDNLRSITDAEERLRAARMVGIDATTLYLQVSQRVADAMKADAALRERLISPEANRAAIDFQAELERVGNAMQLLKDVALSGFLVETARDLGLFADGINEIGKAVQASHIPDLVQGIQQTVRIAAVAAAGMTMGPAGQVGAAEAIAKLLTGKGAGDTATAEHTRAMQDHTKALTESAYLLKYGFETPGQAARARRVVPEAVLNNPLAMRDLLEGQTMAAGGYRL